MSIISMDLTLFEKHEKNSLIVLNADINRMKLARSIKWSEAAFFCDSKLVTSSS